MISNLNQLDAAVLIEKFIVLNGMLLHGTKEEKAQAKAMLEPLQKQALEAINSEAIKQAKFEMNVSDKDLSFSNVVTLFKP